MVTFVAVFAMVLAYLALVTGYLALRTLARLRASTVVLAKAAVDGEHRNLIEITEEQIRTTAAVAAELEQVRTELQAHRGTLDAAVQAGRQQIQTALYQSSTRLDDYRGELDSALAYAVRNIALVRYDAFDEMAGRMSFSLALLDDNGDGLAMTSIAGRDDTRVYAKGIRGGSSDHDLSPEESQAITAAIRNGSDRATAQRNASIARQRRQERRAS
jgi:Protein of unknown function (DUF4446)